MEKQKICIVGGGLTGLITAITLSKLNNIKIDLISNFNNTANMNIGPKQLLKEIIQLC